MCLLFSMVVTQSLKAAAETRTHPRGEARSALARALAPLWACSRSTHAGGALATPPSPCGDSCPPKR